MYTKLDIYILLIHDIWKLITKQIISVYNSDVKDVTSDQPDREKCALKCHYL